MCRLPLISSNSCALAYRIFPELAESFLEEIIFMFGVWHEADDVKRSGFVEGPERRSFSMFVSHNNLMSTYMDLQLYSTGKTPALSSIFIEILAESPSHHALELL